MVKRLTLGLLAANMLNILSFAQDVKFCEANAFIAQFSGSIELLFILGLSLVLFAKILKVTSSWRLVNECYAKVEKCTCTCYGWRINKPEVVFFVSIFVLPLLFDCVPLITDSYGPTGPWCWINTLESNCSTHEAAFWEQMGLWVVPAGLTALLAFGLLTASLLLLCFAVKDTKVQKLIEVGITDSIISLTFLLMATIMTSTKEPLYGWWVAYSIATPIIITLIPLVLLLAIHCPLSSVIHRKKLQITLIVIPNFSLVLQPL